tara:strand:+ start:1900 stop:2103 length:204 start_codon:yes stop_codon:yes gene_type:complete
MTNSQRAEYAFRALKKHAASTGSEGEDTDTQITDLLCNLMHLAEEYAVDFKMCVESAQTHFDAESLE